MQHLAARFVRTLPNAAQLTHVVDPYLDMRSRFVKLEEVENNVRARNLSVDVAMVAEDYAKWWTAFIEVERSEKDVRDQST